jgi:hypothetical protein
MSQSSRQSFNDFSRLPVHDFERQTGVTGISRSYLIPDNMTAHEYEDFYTWKILDGGIKKPGVVEGTALPESRITKIKGDVDQFLMKRSAGYQALLQQGWKKLVDLNPELRKVRLDPKKIDQVYDALMGATSGMNPDDINFYVGAKQKGHDNPGMYFDETPSLALAFEKIAEKSGVRPEWNPSRKTMRVVLGQLTSGH